VPTSFANTSTKSSACRAVLPSWGCLKKMGSPDYTVEIEKDGDTLQLVPAG